MRYVKKRKKKKFEQKKKVFGGLYSTFEIKLKTGG